MGISTWPPAADSYDVLLVILGLGIFAAAFLPRMLWKQPLSMPMVLLSAGILVFKLPLGLTPPDPLATGKLAEHLTEAVVIISLMSAGLKIDRAFHWKRWAVTWRLLGIAMLVSIALVGLLGSWLAGFTPAAALLLGSLIAPTDPVLASEIQVGGPSQGSDNAEVEGEDGPPGTEEDEFRFALTSEAGLNDSLAFPFVNAALAMAVAASGTSWIGSWLLVDVAYKLGVGLAGGWLLGHLLGRVLLSIPGSTPSSKAMVGPGALASTLIIYGAVEIVGAYGFLAVFVGAVAIRNNRREHEYHEHLHTFAEMTERLLTAAVLLGFGGAIAGGLFAPVTPALALAAILIVFVARPLAGWIALLGFQGASRRERLAIGFFGVRGVGSFFYLCHALNLHPFAEARELWALTGLVVLISIFVHGTLAMPVTRMLDRHRQSGTVRPSDGTPASL